MINLASGDKGIYNQVIKDKRGHRKPIIVESPIIIAYVHSLSSSIVFYLTVTTTIITFVQCLRSRAGKNKPYCITSHMSRNIEGLKKQIKIQHTQKGHTLELCTEIFFD
jgi:hypothetical protein